MKNRNKIKLEARTNIVLKYIFSTQGYIPDFNKIFSKTRVTETARPRSKGNASKFCKHRKILWFFQHTMIVRVHGIYRLLKWNN
jgi:hypothetical protein